MVLQQFPGHLRRRCILRLKSRASCSPASGHLSGRVASFLGAASGVASLRYCRECIRVRIISQATISCSRPCRRWVSPRDRRCPLRRRHSLRAVHPEPDAAEAAAGAGVGAGATVTAPGRLLQPPGSGGWAPGAEKLPPHPSPSSHSLEGKTKAERRLGSGARRRLSCPRHAWLAEEGPPLARPPSRQPSPARPAALLAAWLGHRQRRPGEREQRGLRVLGVVAFGRPRQSR